MKNILFFNCILLFSCLCLNAQIEATFELDCSVQEYCGQEYWGGGEVGIVLTGLENAVPSEEGLYDIVIRQLYESNGSFYPASNLYDIGYYFGVALGSVIANGFNDTIYAGEAPLILGQTLLSFIDFSASDVILLPVVFLEINITDANGLESQTILEITDGFLPPCANIFSGFVYTVPDTIYMCDNQLINGGDICAEFYGAIGNQLGYGFFLDEAPPNFDCGDYYNQYSLPENYIAIVEELDSLEELDLSEYANEDLRLGIYRYWGSFNSCNFYDNEVNVPIVFLDDSIGCEQYFPEFEIDFELVCNTADYCGQEYWDQGTVNVLVNITNEGAPFEDGTYEVLIRHYEDNIFGLAPSPVFGFENIQLGNSMVNIQWSDTIYYDTLSLVEGATFLSFDVGNGISIWSDKYFEIIFTDANGLQIDTLLQVTEGGIPFCALNTVPPDLVYDLPDTAYICQGAIVNIDEFCVVPNTGVYYFALTDLSTTMDNSIFPAEFYDLSNPINSTTLPASSVLELGYINLPFLVIYKYYFDYSTGFLGPTGVMVPVVFVEEDIGCILPEQMDLDFGLVCNYDEYCGQTYIDVDKVDIVLADFVEGTPFEDGTYKVTIQDFGVDWFSGALVPGWSGGVALYSMADTLLPFNGSNDTIFSGFLNLSIDESLLSYGFSCSGDVGYNSFVQITITDANGFSIQTLVQTIVTDGSSIWNLPPCASPSEMPYGLFTAVPDTIYVCGNEVLNNDEICAQAPCSGGGWPDGIIYALFLDSAPPSYSLYDDEPENFIDESFSLATLLNENADGPTEDYRVGIYYKLLSYPGGSENTVNVPVVFLDNEDQNCSFLDADIEIVCHTQDYCGQEYWDQGTVDIYINEVVGGIPFENGGYSLLVEYIDIDYPELFPIIFSQNDSIIAVNSDTIYLTDSFIPSETEPTLSYSFGYCSDLIFGDSFIEITIIDSIGNTSSSIVQITQWDEGASSLESIGNPCPELLPSNFIVYSYSEPISLCSYGGSTADICAVQYCDSDFVNIVYALFDGMVPDYFQDSTEYCTAFEAPGNLLDYAFSFDELSLEGTDFIGEEVSLGLYLKHYVTCGFSLSSEVIPVSVVVEEANLQILPLQTLCYPEQNYLILENGDTFYVEGVGSYEPEIIVEQPGECNLKIIAPFEVVQIHEETVLPAIESCTETIELTDTTLILESGETLTYSQIFSNQYGCDSIVSQFVSVLELPVLNINEGLDTIIGPPSGVSLNAVGEFDSFAWSNGVETAETMVNESGLYTVTAITEAGCSQTSEVYVALDLVGLDEPDWAASIRLSPNPTKDVFFLSNVPSEVKEINIYAQSGQLVKRVLPETNKIEINGLMAGVYSVEFVGKRLSVFEQLVVLP